MNSARCTRARSERTPIGRASAAGVSLPEVLVAASIVLAIAAGLAHIAMDARLVFASQPEASDLLQRARTALGWLVEDVESAGSGPYRLPGALPLVRWLPPIHPRRLAPAGGDAETVAVTDRVTVITLPDESPQAIVRDMALPADPVPLAAGSPCPPADPTCGFRDGDEALIFDVTGAFESLVLERSSPGLLVPRAALTKPYAARDGTVIAGARLATYYLDTRRRQLRRTDPSGSDVPVADDVVAMRIR